MPSFQTSHSHGYVSTTVWNNSPSASDSKHVLCVLYNCSSVYYMRMVCIHINFLCMSCALLKGLYCIHVCSSSELYQKLVNYFDYF